MASGSGVGDAGEHVEVIPGLRHTTELGEVIQLPGLDNDGTRLLLSGSGG